MLVIHIYAHCLLIRRRLHSSKNYMHIEERKKEKWMVQSHQFLLSRIQTLFKKPLHPSQQRHVVSSHCVALGHPGLQGRLESKYVISTNSNKDRQTKRGAWVSIELANQHCLPRKIIGKDAYLNLNFCPCSQLGRKGKFTYFVGLVD